MINQAFPHEMDMWGVGSALSKGNNVCDERKKLP